MDVLVVVGAEPGGPPIPARLLAQADHQLAIQGGQATPDTVANLRARIPRAVGVIGPVADALRVATQLHHAGLPVTLYTDQPVTAEPGIDVMALTDRGAPMEVADSLIDLFGNTPLVRLDRIGRDLPCHLLAKLEYLNPGGSVKDRPALAMIEAAEAAGTLRPGGTIVEPTSGNTGVGLAVVAARRRYRCVFTMPDKIAAEKVQLLRAFGAEVIVCPTAVAPEHPESYYSVARRLAGSIPGGFQPDQYHNPNNPAAHEASTGPEIWRQTAGRVSHFVAGIGTGGTISGVGRYLKAQNPAIQIVGADPEGSVYSGGSGRPYLVEGIGEDFWPDTYDRTIADRVVMVSDRDSFLTARRVTREEGLLAGGSCGTAVWAALEIGRDLRPEDVVVVLVPDSGRGYLSKVYNDDWMADYGFLRSGGETVAEVMARKGTDLPLLVHVHPDETVRATIALLKEFGVSQMPVVAAEPPLALAEMVGSVSDRQLLERAFHDPSVVDRGVGEVMERPLPTIGMGETVSEAASRLQGAQAVVVVDNGHPTGILTRSDLLDFLARGPAAGGSGGSAVR
ncbi:MAG TPA: cystathionine beta-synthase [Acidimicrobiales bacterium]|nr:cystathionine beta-synthase [Acidimicrobiales bacterium]